MTQKIGLESVAGPYPHWLEAPRLSADVNRATAKQLRDTLSLSAVVSRRLVSVRRTRPFLTFDDLKAVRGLGPRGVRRLTGRVITPYRRDPHITALGIGGNGRVLAGRPYSLRINFKSATDAPVSVIQVAIHWEGHPYTVQFRVSKPDAERGRVTLKFGRRDYLDVGPARFQVQLLDDCGGTVESGVGIYVMPSNPLSVNLSPGKAHYRSWIARTTLNMPSRSFTTLVDWTVSNTTGATRRFSGHAWIATNGGSHVETVNSGHTFSVSNNGTASFRTTLSSPANSPIGNLFNHSGDLTLRMRLVDDRGVTIEDTIVVQPWLGYNLNIIRVGPLQSGDRSRLALAAGRASSIYQQINLTGNRVENNWLVTGDVSEWDVVSNNDEIRSLFQYASVGNDGLDLFIVRDYTGGTGASFEPGDCSKGGNQDGVVMDRRYDSAGDLYWMGMGQTMAHEFGHYFGLSHTASDTAHDFHVMHPSFREDRTFFEWDEYYDAFDHCFILLIY